MMKSNLFQNLSHLPSFSDLSAADLKKIASTGIHKTLPPGEIVLHEGDESESAYFVLSGKLEVFRLALSGREQVLASLSAGQGFNTAPFFLEEKHNPASVRTIEKAEVMAIPANQFLALLSEIPDFNRLVMRDYSERLKQLTNKVEDLGLYSVRARLVRFILEQADQKEIPSRWTQDEIASHIGTVRDVVGRSLRNLEQEGLIQMQRQRIHLLDRAGLEKIAHSE
jgi:CRP/FNR family cyclic AMP-dependent transcriptional regulator